MADVIQGKFGTRCTRWGRLEYRAQESEERQPDIKRPPHDDLPDFDEALPDVQEGPATPPFTGEDVADRPKPPERDLPTM
jgi:hypothetical protein